MLLIIPVNHPAEFLEVFVVIGKKVIIDFFQSDQIKIFEQGCKLRTAVIAGGDMTFFTDDAALSHIEITFRGALPASRA
jgi:hypothetical protein